ncbi:hypothetical protein ACFL3M_02825 [Patescibacteria group bacterium]
MSGKTNKQYISSDSALQEMYLLEYGTMCKAVAKFMSSSEESRYFAGLWEKLSFSIDLLMLLQKSKDDAVLSIDLHSGSLYEVELKSLTTKLRLKDSTLSKLPESSDLREMLINSILENGKIIPKYLSKIYERSFFEKLDDLRIFSRFTGFSIYNIEEADSSVDATHRCAWGTYDVIHNSPSVYVIDFTSDKKIDQRIANEIAKTIVEKTVGSISPGLLGFKTDEELEYFHPKMVRAFHLKHFSGKSIAGMQNGKLSRGLNEFGNPGEYAAQLKYELAVSYQHSETVNKKLMFFTEKKRRQIWLKSDDPDDQTKMNTRSENYIFMPHRVAQNVNNFVLKDNIIAY